MRTREALVQPARPARRAGAVPPARAAAVRPPARGGVPLGALGGRHEHEAERVARQALRAPTPRRCACGGLIEAGGECPACRAKRTGRTAAPRPASAGLLTAASAPAARAPASVDAALAAPGRPLGAPARAYFEPRLGADLSAVRVHDDATAGASARDVGAAAYAVGSHVVFGPGRYRPDSAGGRELLGHELAHVLQQRASPPVLQRSPAPELDGVTVRPGARAREFIVTARRRIEPGEFFVISVALGRGVSAARAQQLVDAGKDVECAHPSCANGLQPGETVGFYFGPDRSAAAAPPPRRAKPRPAKPASPAPASTVAAPADAPTSSPVQEALASPEMQRYLGLRALYARRHPHQAGGDLTDPGTVDDETLLALQQRLAQLDETDWELLEHSDRAPARDWSEASAGLERYLGSEVRTEAHQEVARRENRIRTAVTGIDVVEEKRATGRLAGLEGLYDEIKDYENAPSGVLGPTEVKSDSFRADEAGLRRQHAKDRLYEIMTGDLGRAHFADVEAFDDAVRDLRAVVGARAVAIALLTMRESERVLHAEHERYREPRELKALFDALAPWRRTGVPIGYAKLVNSHRLLLSPVALHGALESNQWEILGDALRQNAEAQLDNIAASRASLHDDPEVVFEFDQVIEATLGSLGLGKSVQARLIREGRAKPGKSWTRRLLDALLLALSFAFGPLAWVGWAARALSLAAAVYDTAEQQHHHDLLLTAANVGPTPLASKPSNAWQYGAMLNLGLNAAGVMGGAPKSLLPSELVRFGPEALPAAAGVTGDVATAAAHELPAAAGTTDEAVAAAARDAPATPVRPQVPDVPEPPAATATPARELEEELGAQRQLAASRGERPLADDAAKGAAKPARPAARDVAADDAAKGSAKRLDKGRGDASAGDTGKGGTRRPATAGTPPPPVAPKPTGLAETANNRLNRLTRRAERFLASYPGAGGFFDEIDRTRRLILDGKLAEAGAQIQLLEQGLADAESLLGHVAPGGSAAAQRADVEELEELSRAGGRTPLKNIEGLRMRPVVAADAPELALERWTLEQRPPTSAADLAEQQAILANPNRSRAGIDYEEFIKRRQVREPPVSRPGRRPDFGDTEITLEGMGRLFGEHKMQQFWLDLMDRRGIRLIVPRLAPEAAVQLRQLAHAAEQALGEQVTVDVIETLP